MLSLIWLFLGAILIYLMLSRKNLLAGNTVFICVTSILAFLTILPALAFLSVYLIYSSSSAIKKLIPVIIILVPVVGMIFIFRGASLKTRTAIPFITLGVMEIVAFVSLLFGLR